MKISDLVNKNLINFTPYQSARRIGGEGSVFVNANENPYYNKYSLKENIFNRYPDPQPKDLISSYSNFISIPAKNILVSRGSDDSIDLLIRSFCNYSIDSILYCPPTYDMYKITSLAYGISFKEIPLNDNFELNLSEMEKNLSKVKIVFICSPNNPTGSLINFNDIKYLLEITRNKCIVVIDEAYVEFTQREIFTQEIFNFDHLVVIRTLSKAFALAGIRCGFVITSEEIINILLKAMAPYPIPSPVIDIASQALSNIELMRKSVIKINNNKKFLIDNLKNLKIVDQVYSSFANFVLVKFRNFQEVFDYLWSNGIILRNQNLQVKSCLRITVGTDEENRIILNQLKEYEVKFFKGD